ncbi:MAG: MmgE/PrpD family protein, partial [Alcaligenaceae bacterium]|nr:MmgE/PrpD family protein [Alcaligenaceae bacterium]
MSTSSHVIAEFASNLQFDDIPTEVIRRCEDLLLDTLGSMYAGSTEPPVQKIAAFAKEQGPSDGRAQLIPSGAKTSPYFAAMVNAAAAHMVEQDDLHNSSVFHPACVVFPPALAMAQDLDVNGKALLTACVVGYEVGIRVGEFLGRSHYKIFHTTATAGTIAAAATVGRLLNLSTEQMQD